MVTSYDHDHLIVLDWGHDAISS